MVVKVYTTPASPWCAQAKAFLEAKGVAFEEIDVSRDPRLLKELRDLSGQIGVPVIVHGTSIVIGFDPTALESLAAKARSAP
ncbi:MAG TPA: glutaredoxin domain-containing protein [Thermoplasmata archaeon]|nr:glutaredoxin domain-containing protein [Thermoplasmata archaeon]